MKRHEVGEGGGSKEGAVRDKSGDGSGSSLPRNPGKPSRRSNTTAWSLTKQRRRETKFIFKSASFLSSDGRPHPEDTQANYGATAYHADIPPRQGGQHIPKPLRQPLSRRRVRSRKHRQQVRRHLESPRVRDTSNKKRDFEVEPPPKSEGGAHHLTAGR